MQNDWGEASRSHWLLYPPLGADIFDSGPTPAKTGQKPTKTDPKPPQTGPKPSQNQPKPVQNRPKTKSFDSGQIYPSWGRIYWLRANNIPELAPGSQDVLGTGECREVGGEQVDRLTDNIPVLVSSTNVKILDFRFGWWNRRCHEMASELVSWAH